MTSKLVFIARSETHSESKGEGAARATLGSETGQPAVSISTVIRREAMALEGGVFTPSPAQVGEGGRVPVEDNVVPVFPEVPATQEDESRGRAPGEGSLKATFPGSFKNTTIMKSNYNSYTCVLANCIPSGIQICLQTTFTWSCPPGYWGPSELLLPPFWCIGLARIPRSSFWQI
jgi:hypothetical protein